MCGIAGIYSMNGSPLKDPISRIKRMLNIQYNRGPDASGFSFSEDKRLILGNTRLSIVDINTNLPLPFIKTGSKNMLSFNGEIFNYKYLKNILIRKGSKFKTKSDTEVLFEALRVFNEEVYKHLSGMWGFAYYDDKEKSLILSRDVLGERHVFFKIINGELVFASDPKAIIAATNKNEINYDEIPIIWMFNSASPGNTLVKNINRLLPGQSINIKDTKFKSRIHSKLEPELWTDFFRSKPSTKKVIETFESHFQKSINERIPEEVKYISTLSGGIDSTLVNYFLSKNSKKVNAIFGKSSNKIILKSNDNLDESQAASFTSEKLGINLTKFDMLIEDPVEALKDAASDGFDGCIDDGVVPFSMLAKKARSLGCKVILISDGPDDFAGGYKVDQKLFNTDKFYFQDNKLLKFGKIISNYEPCRKIFMTFFGNHSLVGDEMSYIPFRSPVTHQIHKKKFLEKIFEKNFLEKNYNFYGTLPDYYDFDSDDYSIKRALCYATKSTPDMFNLRIDKAFMKHSVEVRLPFQDKELVEFLVALPSWFRFSSGEETKFILRKIVQQNVGNEISSRQKYGFAHHLWDDDKVFKELNMRDAIIKSDLFKHKMFKKNAVDLILDKNSHRGLSWSAYALSSSEKILASNYKTY